MSAMLKDPITTAPAAQPGVINVQDLHTLNADHTIQHGDWAFVPARLMDSRRLPLILRNEPIRHGEQNMHFCEQLVRFISGRVYIHPQWAPDGISEIRYRRWIARNPHMAEGWTVNTPGQQIFVRGTIQHAIYGMLALEGWHRAIPLRN